MAGIQLAWHLLAKERTSKIPSTQPHTPSSSSRMKLYSGHNAKHGPRHLQEGKLTYWAVSGCLESRGKSPVFLCNPTQTYLPRYLGEQHWILEHPESSGGADEPSDTTPPRQTDRHIHPQRLLIPDMAGMSDSFVPHASCITNFQVTEVFFFFKLSVCILYLLVS